jgi:hypothetical protein
MAKTTIELTHFQDLIETLVKMKSKQHDTGIRLGISFAIEKVEESMMKVREEQNLLKK